ncbi:hypothetical protein ACKAV7_010935 [Fusarium commune]
MASLYYKEAYSALRKSRDTAICITSDIESDTKDEDDVSQELDSLQSYATRTSTPDYLDLTAADHGATESEATIGVDTAPVVSPAQAEAAPAWPNETQASHLADAEPIQQSSSPTVIRIPPKLAHTLRGLPAPSRWYRHHSSDPEFEAVDDGPGSPDKARSSPQLPSPRRSRRRSPHAHKTAQDEDSDADTESSGSEDGPDVPEYARDEDYCPSPPEVQGSGSEDDDVDDEEHRRG